MLKKLLPTNYFETEYAIKCTMLFFNLIAMLDDLNEKKKSYLLFGCFGDFIFWIHYLLATNNLTSFDFEVIGFVTPGWTPA
jgi:hypothetical protein